MVKDISRVARNTVDFLQSIRILKSSGINVVFITANMTSLGDSEFILTIFGAMAQEESGNLSKRVKWGKKINAKKGRVPQRIYGYDSIDNFTLQVNPAEANVVRRIFYLYLNEGLGWSFCRRKYTYVNTREYWICSKNSQYTAEQCDNLVKIEKAELFAEIQTYFSALIQDKDRFIQGILSEVNKHRSDVQNQVKVEDIEKKRKRLLSRKSRYQEMYVNDVMTMAELKEKTEQITVELAALDDSLKLLERLKLS